MPNVGTFHAAPGNPMRTARTPATRVMTMARPIIPGMDGSPDFAAWLAMTMAPIQAR